MHAPHVTKLYVIHVGILYNHITLFPQYSIVRHCQYVFSHIACVITGLCILHIYSGTCMCAMCLTPCGPHDCVIRITPMHRPQQWAIFRVPQTEKTASRVTCAFQPCKVPSLWGGPVRWGAGTGLPLGWGPSAISRMCIGLGPGGRGSHRVTSPRRRLQGGVGGSLGWRGSRRGPVPQSVPTQHLLPLGRGCPRSRRSMSACRWNGASACYS